MGTDICLAVAKYSHATGVRPDGSVSFTHVVSSNLYVILKGTDKSTADEQLMLRIVKGQEVLDSLDVAAYVDRARALRRTALANGRLLHVEQQPIFATTEQRAIAVRWTLQDGRARRVQLRMNSPAEALQIARAFRNRGMEFRERPSTARPVTARPSIVGSQTTMPSVSPHFTAPGQPTSHPFTPQVLEAGSLSQQRSALPTHDRDDHAASHHQTSTPSHTMMPSTPFIRDEIFAPREVVPNRPSTAQFYRSHHQEPTYTPTNARDLQFDLHTAAAQPAGPSTTNHPGTTEAVGRSDTPFHSAASEQLEYPVSKAPGLSSSTSMEAPVAIADRFSDGRPSTARPGTSSSFVFAETLEHEIPPRRELPFARPDSRRNDGKSRTRPKLTLPTLASTRPITSGAQAVSNEQRDSGAERPRPHTSSSLKRPFDNIESRDRGTDRPRTSSPLKPTSQERVSSPQAPAKQLGRMEQLLDTRKAALTQTPASKAALTQTSVSKACRVDSLADAPGEDDDQYVQTEPSPSKTPTKRDSLSPLRGSMVTHDPIKNAYAAISSAGADQTSSLQQYAEQSLEDRQAALDEFMVQNLENPNFMRLCKDVENCWRRIALGL